MASLAPVHWETVTDELRASLRFIGRQAFSESFYLAGGSAVALRLGHRRSVDLDFFSLSDNVERLMRTRIMAALAPLKPSAIEDHDGNLHVRIGGLRAAFQSYHYPLLEPTDELEGVAVASIADLGSMKLDAVMSRGRRRDFYDLYAIDQRMPLSTVIERATEKYAHFRDFELSAVEALGLFHVADSDLQPDLLVDLPWPVVREHFAEFVRQQARSWFDE